jgi:hypothetical protein
MFKWIRKKVLPPPAPQLSALGAELVEAVQNPDEWEANEHLLHHSSGLDLWIANKNENHTHFRIYRLPTVVINSSMAASRAGEERLERMLNRDDKRVLAPMAYALHETLYGKLEFTTLNALRLARQTAFSNKQENQP